MSYRQSNLFNKSKHKNVGGYYCRRLHVSQPDRCCSDCNYHPSILELKVARIIDEMVPEDCWTVHYPLKVAPKQEKTDSKSWKVDFRIHSSILNRDCPELFIEAKGLELPDFRANLTLLQYFNPEALGKLVVVSTQKKQGTELFERVTLKNFRAYLYGKTHKVCPRPSWAS